MNPKVSNKRMMKILIVEDSPLFQELLVQSLSLIHEIQIVGKENNPTDAINRVKQVSPDIVILDLRLHGGSGFDVLDYIKKNNTDTKVIVMSNFANAQFQNKCRDMGADFFLDKSKDFSELPSVVNRIHGLVN
jgi:DNA-binding NarL/FixJ family response regulator